MDRDPRSLLWDVVHAGQDIESFVQGLSSDAYAAHPLVHSAVERKFEIIGEARSQLSKLDPALSGRIPQLRSVIGLRNILIHGYAEVRHDTVWKIIQQSLPQLRTQVQALLDELA